MSASVLRKGQGALSKASRPPVPDAPPAAGFRFAAIPRLPGEGAGNLVEACND
jgi:hypothetical protein